MYEKKKKRFKQKGKKIFTIKEEEKYQNLIKSKSGKDEWRKSEYYNGENINLKAGKYYYTKTNET